MSMFSAILTLGSCEVMYFLGNASFSGSLDLPAVVRLVCFSGTSGMREVV